MNWLLSIWYKRLRRIDLEILWPACKDQAIDLDYAKAAFCLHAMSDEAWLFLGEDEVLKFIGQLQ
jgi:hypothetical protein